jgi:hypothetical protein
MNLESHIKRRYAAAFPLAVIAMLLAQACTSQTPANAPPANMPDNLQVSGSIVAEVHAEGFQVYALKRNAAGNLAWALKAPDATFENANGLRGKHYAGPTWECTTDGSKVVGKKIADHSSPAADAIPWLLLAATSHDGAGIFSTVTFIQRINTTGGKAPASTDGKEGDEIRVPYTAQYIFYGPGAMTVPTR